MKEDSKKNPRNQKSLNLDLISRINHQMNKGKISENKIAKTEIKREINSNYNSKMKFKAIRRLIRMKHHH